MAGVVAGVGLEVEVEVGIEVEGEIEVEVGIEVGVGVVVEVAVRIGAEVILKSGDHRIPAVSTLHHITGVSRKSEVAEDDVVRRLQSHELPDIMNHEATRSCNEDPIFDGHERGRIEMRPRTASRRCTRTCGSPRTRAQCASRTSPRGERSGRSSEDVNTK